MKKNSLIISIFIIATLLILSSCSTDTPGNDIEQVSSEISKTNDNAMNNSSTDASSSDNTGNDSNKDDATTDITNAAQQSASSYESLEEIFPEYMKVMDSIAGDLIVSLEELERKDQYYFEKNPEEGIEVFNNILKDFNSYKSELQDLEYNNNPDIDQVTNLFIEGLDANIKIIEMSIESLKNEEYDQDVFVDLLEKSAEKFEKFGGAYRELAEKAGYNPEN